MEIIMANSHTIEIAQDNAEAAQFCAWLVDQGHRATVGRSTGNYVDGKWTSTDDTASEIMAQLWNDYCNS